MFHGGFLVLSEIDYIGGIIMDYFDWVNFEKLSLLDIDCVATHLGYKLLMGY